MKIEIETITPAKAKKMLELNVCNRNVRESRVCEYANEMAAGRWRLTGQGIIILEDGTVGDGQHRLYAIVKSGATVQMPVARGAKKETMAVIDIGAKRTTADYMHLHHGIKNATRVCGSVNIIYFIAFNFQSFTVQPHIAKIGIDYFYEQIREIIVINGNFSVGKNSLITGALAFAAKTNPRIIEFVKQFATGENLKAGDPAFVMRNWVINGNALQSSNPSRKTTLECIFNCLMAFMKGKTMGKMKSGQEGVSYFRARNREFIELVQEEVRRLKKN
jgi:hypothetical protein